MMGMGSSGTESGWRRSSFCSNGACVEVAFVDGNIAVRDSKDSTGSVQLYTADEWQSFVAGVKNGEFDLPSR